MQQKVPWQIKTTHFGHMVRYQDHLSTKMASSQFNNALQLSF